MRLLILSLFNITTGLVFAGPVPSNKPDNYPSWWFIYDVITRLPHAVNNSTPSWPNDYSSPNDYSTVNQGQLRYFAKKAFDCLNYNSAFVYNQNTAHYKALAELWLNPKASSNDYLLVNVGKLKNTVKPFYDFLSRQYDHGLQFPFTNQTIAND